MKLAADLRWLAAVSRSIADSAGSPAASNHCAAASRASIARGHRPASSSARARRRWACPARSGWPVGGSGGRRCLPQPGRVAESARELRAVGQPLDDLDPRDERSAVLVKRPPESCCSVPVRPDTRRQLGGLDQPRHGLVRLTGIEPMAGHCERFCVPRGEKDRDLAVGRASFVRWHFLVHHVSDEGMPERYGAVRAGHQDPAFQTGLDPSAGVRDDPFDECYVNLVAHDRRDRERLPVPGRHPIGADEDGVSERLRDGQVGLNQGRQTVDDRDRAFCQECARELLDEKRESLTAIHEPAGKDGVGSRSEDARRKLAGRVDPQ